MKIHPYIQQASNAIISLGFGILTVERFLKVANLAIDTLQCQEPYNRCQMPIFKSIKTLATMVAAGYTSFKFAQAIMPQSQSRYIPRTLKPGELHKATDELVAFHPGAQARSREKADDKVYILDSFDSLHSDAVSESVSEDKKEL